MNVFIYNFSTFTNMHLEDKFWLKSNSSHKLFQVNPTVSLLLVLLFNRNLKVILLEQSKSNR